MIWSAGVLINLTPGSKCARLVSSVRFYRGAACVRRPTASGEFVARGGTGQRTREVVVGGGTIFVCTVGIDASWPQIVATNCERLSLGTICFRLVGRQWTVVTMQ